MALDITRSPRARRDLLEIWSYIADDNEHAADRMLDRFERALRIVADNPEAGRGRPDLAPGLRSYSVCNYVLYYRPTVLAIELVRVRSGYRDIQPEDMG